ncbi:MAG TPA: hypothetical protein VGD45_01920 [Steroidobacter sp.]
MPATQTDYDDARVVREYSLDPSNAPALNNLQNIDTKSARSMSA